jgi:Fe-S-cluster containining protein
MADPFRNGHGNGFDPAPLVPETAGSNALVRGEAPPLEKEAAVPARTQRYNCMKCPGYCCSYPIIVVSKYDLGRLARWFGLTPEVAEKRFTRSGYGFKRIMRRKADEHFGRICRFFDTEKRRCTIYPARPQVCRAFPGGGRCGYYDFLSFERRAQNDPEFVASTDHR